MSPDIEDGSGAGLADARPQPEHAYQHIDARRDDGRARFQETALPHLDDALRLASWIAGNPTDAEDIVQDAYLRIFRAIDSFNGENPRPWIMTIVRNTAYSWLRRNRPAALTFEADLEAIEAANFAQATGSGSAAVSLEADLIAKTDAARLKTAMASLSSDLRETLALREMQGCSYREIAAIVGVPIGTVMSRLARARNQLLRLLADETVAAKAAPLRRG